jgi:3-hydroxyacyl-CoA dehydrogenase
MGTVRVARQGGVAILTLDSPPVNALGSAVRADLSQALMLALDDPLVRAIVLAAAGSTSSAGADIREFGKPPVAGAPLLTELCNQIEASDKPVVAAIQGAALGGGMELALATHWRVAGPRARLGLPEVALGILPGAGGTQRTPRLTGAGPALRLMLSGQPVPAPEALGMGLVDDVADDPVQAAIAMATDLAANGTPPRRTRDRAGGLADPARFRAEIAAARAELSGPLPAPARIIDCVEAALTLPFDQGLALERAAFLDLAASPRSRGLRHAFFAERRAGTFPEAAAEARPVTHVGLVGHDPTSPLPAALEKAGVTVTLADPGNLTALAPCDLVIEALEAGARKAEVLARLGATLRPGAVIATLVAHEDPVRLARASGRAADVVGFNLGGLSGGRLAEIAVGPETAAGAVATLAALMRKAGRLPVRVAAAPGLVGPRMLAALRTACGLMQHDGVPADDIRHALRAFGLAAPDLGPPRPLPQQPATLPPDEITLRCLCALANQGLHILGQGLARRPGDIDAIWLAGYGFPRWEGGPMAWATAQGLPNVQAILRRLAPQSPGLWSPAPLLDRLVDQGRSLDSLDPG